MGNITHSKVSSLSKRVKQLQIQLLKRKDTTYTSLERQLQLLQELTSFPLGRYLIQHQGINAKLASQFLEKQRKKLHPLEYFLGYQTPTAKANQERFSILQTLLSKYLKEGMKVASIPCGYMKDLLTLAHLPKELSLFGIDIDPGALKGAVELAKKKKVKASFFCEDAWHLSFQNTFDVITSSSLNIYVKDRLQLKKLYQSFFSALKEGGVFLTSYLSFPFFHKSCEWKMQEVDLQKAVLQKVIMTDILQARWENFSGKKEMENLLRSVGFHPICFYPDRANIFPSVVAFKKQP